MSARDAGRWHRFGALWATLGPAALRSALRRDSRERIGA